MESNSSDLILWLNAIENEDFSLKIFTINLIASWISLYCFISFHVQQLHFIHDPKLFRIEKWSTSRNAFNFVFPLLTSLFPSTRIIFQYICQRLSFGIETTKILFSISLRQRIGQLNNLSMFWASNNKQLMTCNEIKPNYMISSCKWDGIFYGHIFVLVKLKFKMPTKRGCSKAFFFSLQCEHIKTRSTCQLSDFVLWRRICNNIKDISI